MAELEAESQSLQASLVEGREVALGAIERLEARHERFVEHTSRHDDGLWSWFERILLSQNRVDVPKGPLLEAISATLETTSERLLTAAAMRGCRSNASRWAPNRVCREGRCPARLMPAVRGAAHLPPL